MPPEEARAWWADVEHLREDLERRRARREGRPTPPLRVVQGGGQGTSDRRGPREPLRVASTADVPRPRPARRASEADAPRARPARRTPEADVPGSREAPRPRRGEPGRFTPSADAAAQNPQREPGPSLGELLKARLDAGIAAVRAPLATREERLATTPSARAQRRSEPPLHEPPPPEPRGEGRAADDSRAAARRAAREAFADWSVAEPPRPGERRTIQVRGRQDDPPRLARTGGRPDPIVRRPVPSARDRIDHRPDRVAAWAVALAFLLILMAAATANAAALPLS